jgi:hypothetical protein
MTGAREERVTPAAILATPFPLVPVCHPESGEYRT